MAKRDKIITCGKKSYYVQIFNERDVRVRLDNTAFRGNGRLIADTTSLEDALSVIKADAGSDQLSMRDY